VTLRPAHQIVAAIVAVILLMALAIGVQRVRDRLYPRRSVSAGQLYLASGSAVRKLSLGYTALAADLYWIRALQYYGALRLQSERTGVNRQGEARAPQEAEPKAARPNDGNGYELLYPLLDVTTSLDPRFDIAYRFGSIFLAEPPPGGAGRADLAIRLLEKGLRERPDKWEYMMDIGFVHYWWTRDYRTAAGWFDRASALAGAPAWLRALAATTLATGGDRKTSRRIWTEIRQSAEVDWLRQQADWRLLQLRALDEIEALQRTVDGETMQSGKSPEGWRRLIEAGRLPGVPADPTGIPYELDANGRVTLGRRSTLRPLPDEPAPRPAIS
jgi:tetratricopeptide (TPR) repeat protein